MKDNIIKVDYTEEMEKSYIDYAMSVIVQRAIPDLRDGLKPVHRRILFAMDDLKLAPDKSFKKSARIIGDVLGKYHPHSDASVYEAMVRLAQDFNTNYPLVEGQGNFGSIDGDPAAAMRYTEARLMPLAMNLLRGLDKDIVNYTDNFDGSMKEPEVLPAKFFNLLVNGSTGIAVGMSTNIPPHNLAEVNNACKALLRDESLSSKKLMKYIKGPDFPTGGEIINQDELKSIYESGSGRVRVRAIFQLEELKGGRKNLIISEIPYTFAGNKTRLLENIIDLVNDRKLDEISDVRDESSKDGIRIVLEVKKGVAIDMLKAKLFQTTRLEDTVTVNMLSIVDNRPATLSLRDMILEYNSFLKTSYIREFNHDLNRLKIDREINEGLLEAYDIIDLIIEIIRGSNKREDVLNCLMKGDTSRINFKSTKSRDRAKKLSFSPRQADSIMRMQLQRLVGLEIGKIRDTLSKIRAEIERLELLIAHEDRLIDHICQELDSITDQFKRRRKTSITTIDQEEEYVEEIIVEEVYALIDRFNYVKIIDSQSYSRSNKETLEGYNYVIRLMSNDRLWIFADDGNFYQLRLEELPISKMADRGNPLPNDLEILYANSQENILGKELVFATKNGYVKRTDSGEFETNRRQIFSSKLGQDDSLIFVDLLTEDKQEIVLTTKEKRKIRFEIGEISSQKRNALGVRGINLNQGDYVTRVRLDPRTDLPKRNRGAKGAIIKK